MRLSDKKNNTPIPYRDSKLTRLLQPALEGDSKVSIICNISPCSDAYDETLSTLKFAQRAKKIKQTILKNDTSDSKALILKYEREISELQEKLREMESKLAVEEKVASDLMVSSKLVQLQEEKEKADARLDRILQEKLQLSEDLERLKSFIIHADDRPVKNSEESGRKGNRPKTFVFKSPVLEEIKERKDEAFDREPFETQASPRYRRNDTEKNESLLLDGVEDIEKFFKDETPKNQLRPQAFSFEDYLKIIDQQAKQIEELNQIVWEKSRAQEYDDEKDRNISELLKIIEGKDERILELEDELKLCRNNLTRMQIAFRNQKEKQK
jgi:predicted  nucleic acid-binding Zn-ribbon protein